MPENEIIVKKETILAAARQQELGELLRPLTREIHLFDSYIAGTTKLKDASVPEALKPGDKLTLMREESKFDDHAIVLKNAQGQKAGYVPEKDNVIFARLMDAGKMLSAAVTGTERRGSFLQIRIAIYLVDF